MTAVQLTEAGRDKLKEMIDKFYESPVFFQPQGGTVRFAFEVPLTDDHFKQELKPTST